MVHASLRASSLRVVSLVCNVRVQGGLFEVENERNDFPCIPSQLVLVGGGGRERASDHVEKTARLIKSLALTRGDLVFLLDEREIAAASPSPGVDPFDQASWAGQLDMLRQGLSSLRERGVRAEGDERDETLGKRIRDAELQKIPYVVVWGERESREQMAVRKRGGEGVSTMSLDTLVGEIAAERPG